MIADRYTGRYFKLLQSKPGELPPIDPILLAEEIVKLNVSFTPLCDDGSVLGLAVFEDVLLTVCLPNGKIVSYQLSDGDVLIDTGLQQDGLLGRCNFTIAHEAGHHILNRLFPEEHRQMRNRRTHIMYRRRAESVNWVESRIDSGKEYALLCGALEAAPDSKPYYALVYIHEDFDGKVKISDIKDMSPNGELADKWKNIQALYGSWRVPENAAEGVEIFEAATANITDTIFSVISVMGEQIVAGKNYCVLCQCHTRGNEMPFYAFVYVNKNLENNFKVSRIVDLDASGQPVSTQF